MMKIQRISNVCLSNSYISCNISCNNLILLLHILLISLCKTLKIPQKHYYSNNLNLKLDFIQTKILLLNKK
jgi:hypothetical protein